MKCGHCKSYDVSVSHVRACAYNESAVRSIGAPRRMEVFDRYDDILAALSHDVDVEGVYFKDGAYYKVQVGTNTGNAYAKGWCADGTKNEPEPHWEYLGRKPLYHLTLADKVSAEDAARFGHVTGQCVFCGRKLTDERSIAVGYGPKCAENTGLPWGELNNSHPETGTLAQQRAMVEYEGV